MQPFRFQRLLPWLLPAALQLCFLVAALQTGHTHTRDSYEYLQQAENILRHGSFSCGDLQQPVTDVTLYSRRPPGYGLFILLTSLLLQWPVLTLLCQSLLSVFNLYLGYRLLHTLAPGFRRPWYFVAVASLIPSQFSLAALYMSEIPFQTTILLSLLSLLRYLREPDRPRTLCLHHGWLLCAYLLKPVALYLWPLSVLLVLFTRRTTLLALLTTAHLLVTGTMLLRNQAHTGAAEYSSIGHKVLMNYQLPAIFRQLHGATETDRRMDSLQRALHEKSWPEQEAVIQEVWWQQFREHPATVLRLHTTALLSFFLDGGRWELETIFPLTQQPPRTFSLGQALRTDGIAAFERLAEGWPLPVLLYYLLTLLVNGGCSLAALGWFLRAGTPKHHRLVLGGLLLYFSLLTGPSASARFRIPVSLITVSTALALLHQREQRTKSAAPAPH